jgi:hypothetical protein
VTEDEQEVSEIEWIIARLLDARGETSEAYKMVVDKPGAQVRLANAIGTMDTVLRRFHRPEDETLKPVNDIEPRRRLPWYKRMKW